MYRELSRGEETASGPGWRPRKEADSIRAPVQYDTNAQSRALSNIPQTSGLRRPSAGQSDRPLLYHQPQSWGSVGSASSASARVATKVVSPSASTTVRLPSTGSKATRNVLRRKHSGLTTETGTPYQDSQKEPARTGSSSSNPLSQTPLGAHSAQFDRHLMESPMGTRVIHQVEPPKTIYPELDRYQHVRPVVPWEGSEIEVPFRLATQDLPPPTPLFSGTSSQVSGFSGSPSTRFSESPGPGPYSRDTTPTSMSSQSPGFVKPMRMPTARARQPELVHTRPPVTRRRTGSVSDGPASVSDLNGLAAVRESLTSSSSGSTVRDGDKKDKAERKKKKRLSPLPPSPPPRKSSQKFVKIRDEEESPSKSTTEPARRPRTKEGSSERATSTSRSQPVTSPRATAPTRPSRDGTPDLHSQLDMSFPVVHSNLSSSSLTERRQSGTFVRGLADRPTTPSHIPGRQQSSTRVPTAREATPAPRLPIAGVYSGEPATTTTSISAPGRTIRTPSPSVSHFKTRFPLFGKKTKPAPESAQPEKKERLTRKGPAAGTGHEGYGRLGAPRRRSSSAARVPQEPVSSQESLVSDQSHDQFFLDRMAPVIIAGGAVVENRNNGSELSRTESDRSLPFFTRPFGSDSKNGSDISLSSREGGPRDTLWPSAIPRGTTSSSAHFGGSRAPSSLSSRRPSDSSDSEALAMRSTLAFRRSMQKLKAGDQQAAKVPKPIVTRAEVVSPAVTSIDASVMSDDSMSEVARGHAYFERGRKGSELSTKSTSASTPPTKKKLTKRVRSPRRWNLFGRSQSQPAVVEKKPEPSSSVAATVRAVQSKPVAFYTMMDSSEQEDVDPLDIEEVLREARGLDMSGTQAQTARERRPSATRKMSSDSGAGPKAPAARTPTAPRRAVTSPLTSPEHPTPGPPAGPIGKDASKSSQVTSRPSRLAQVGRIPKVVSARPEPTSSKSFSRPFSRVSVQFTPPRRVDIEDPESLAKGPSPPRPSTPELTQDESTPATSTVTNISASRQDGLGSEEPLENGQLGREFLSFSPRKNSQGTVTTTSSSSGIVNYAAATAVIPGPNAPLVEDEVWDEFNDLLGEETVKVPPSPGSSAGKPFHLEIYSMKTGNRIEEPLESPTYSPPALQMPSLGQMMEESMQEQRPPPTSSVYSADMTAKIKEVLELLPEPDTPFSVSEFVRGYGDSVESLHQVEPVQQKSPSRQGLVRQSNASGSSQGSEDNSPAAQVNLRVGSMTVSKWLTFGHVLFSPVRDELVAPVGSLKRQSILVVDGLGNDDWSFYASETYPAATFFNLSPRAPIPKDRRSSTALPISPENHHQVQYMSCIDKVPFGPHSFASLVYRFPVAASESHYANIIAEARRVIKPGGFIELSILDLDLNNMGNRCRRAVRHLKERVHTDAPDTCLGSVSDLIVRLLGRKGFVDIKTCRVGVPVASAITRSSSRSEPGEPNATPLAGSALQAGSSGLNTKTKKPRKRDTRSLAELMSDEGAVADESITKMVASVGRWWYSRCYEGAAGLGPVEKSMWHDKALLAECEEWGTSLKLMVCHARVPDGKARVASI
jgi:hypothetical protein